MAGATINCCCQKKVEKTKVIGWEQNVEKENVNISIIKILKKSKMSKIVKKKLKISKMYFFF